MNIPEEQPFRSRTILRARDGDAPEPHLDQLAVEEPLEIRVDTRPVSVTMRTPGHDNELALGFLFSEGLIRSAADLLKTSRSVSPATNQIDVYLRVSLDFSRLTRHFFASSSCGICGKATIEAVHQHFPPVESSLQVAAHTVLSLPEKLQQAQDTFRETGGLHAAAVFDHMGNLIVIREDVGRHNAVDKVLGYGLIHQMLPFDTHILVVSGRASLEILQKALAGRIPIVAAVSAPSTLAAEFAEASRQTLIGFLRNKRMNIYSGQERIRFDG